MPSVDESKDYEVVHEDSHEDGFKNVTVTAVDEGEPVEVHVYGRREDKEEFDRLRGCTLLGPPEYEHDMATLGIPIDVDDNEILVYEDIRVEAHGPVDSVEAEVRDA